MSENIVSLKSKYVLAGKEYSHEELALLAVGCSLEKKASQPVIMDLRHLESFVEMFLILSAANGRQVYALAQEIKVFFKKAFGLSPLTIDGLESCHWVLIDYGFLFIHIFQEPTRQMYQLEKLWSKARMLDVSEDQCALKYQEALKLSASDEDQSA